MEKKLEKNKAARLGKLIKEWETAEGQFDGITPFEKISVLDLILLLEYHTPLQTLIRRILGVELQATPSIQHSAVGIEQATPLALPAPDTQALQKAQQALVSIQAELAQAKQTQAEQEQQSAQKLTKATADLNACNAETIKLRKKEDSYKQEIKALKDKCKQLQDELTIALSHTSATPELSFLRNDPQRAQSMGLDDLPADDTQALIQAVAVLAQLDNLKRLWEVLKDRCETEKRPASTDENALLQAALAWHNHNWRSLPYRLINPASASRYDYETQLRSRHVTKGETVATMHLPGIADGSGKALCKALVQTK